MKNFVTVGTIQFSREHFLDSGGYGHVYLGRCERSNSEVVIKRMQWHGENREEIIDRELTALQNLSHPNIVKFFDSSSDDDFT
jgi:serine/threonine protein kinase